MALMTLMNKWANDDEHGIEVFLDFPKAFDTVLILPYFRKSTVLKEIIYHGSRAI